MRTETLLGMFEKQKKRKKQEKCELIHNTPNLQICINAKSEGIYLVNCIQLYVMQN